MRARSRYAPIPTLARSLLWLGCCVLVGTWLLGAPAPTKADAIKDLMDSKGYKRIARRNPGGKELYGPKWLKPGSSYARVFTEGEGGRLLLDWLGVSSTGLTLGQLETTLQPEYSSGTRELLTKDLKKISISAYLPHPKYRDTVDMGLVEVFVADLPPKISILYAEKIQLQGAEGIAYEHESGSASVVVKGNKGVLVVLKTAKLKDKEDLIEFAKKLDFSRLNERIEA